MNIPLNIDWQQILLHLMNFVILAGGLYFLLYKPVKAFMDKRAAYYQEQADQAAQTTQAAQQLKADYEARLSAADDEIREEKKRRRRMLPPPRSSSSTPPRPRPRRSSPTRRPWPNAAVRRSCVRPVRT